MAIVRNAGRVPDDGTSASEFCRAVLIIGQALEGKVNDRLHFLRTGNVVGLRMSDCDERCEIEVAVVNVDGLQCPECPAWELRLPELFAKLTFSGIARGLALFQPSARKANLSRMVGKMSRSDG